MNETIPLDRVLDFAIEREQEAIDFYTGLAGKATSAEMRRVFEQFAGEERGHKARLQGVRAGKPMQAPVKPVMDLRISDYVVATEPGPDISYQDALILAMKKEKAAFRLYTDMAELVGDDELKDLLLALAQEEAKHKLRFEVEYDDRFLKNW
ncbi:MAG: ferritin family protein [Candidatus Eisenbacteria bacterium]|uniref:Ferritin family protein n=1 Tax=Eiseniibacteriota bacterium TaxID=2212470 RepID=A0A938BQM5_UNCEI|nr:ferritin family protein [Candidatus Eisenbacteria bacterium]